MHILVFMDFVFKKQVILKMRDPKTDFETLNNLPNFLLIFLSNQKRKKCYYKFLLGYIHMGGFILTIPNRLILYIG
jgi:hypothetical protein